MTLKNISRTIKTSAAAALCLFASFSFASPASAKDFLKVKGKDIVDSKGSKFFIKGTNLGNWVNPEGYMFGFKKVNSYSMINDAICQLVGPAEAEAFWKAFRDNYITEADIEFIAGKGANTIRFPFHYKLFTDDPYMGMKSAEEGFAMLDTLIGWARKNNVRLILDMHDCPGGQTGDNIDDSYGYPFLMTDKRSQKEFTELWKKIAGRYKDEDVILGYELMNEPIATFWEGDEKAMLNAQLEPLYKEAAKAIREVDGNHIILLGGAQWNSNFEPFSDWTFDDNIMYTCHRYGGESTPEAIKSFIDFRDKTGLPMYMGELGHNTDEWISGFATTMRDNNIGYTYWPYKKIEDSSMTGVKTPENWQLIVDFTEAPRGSYAEIREARKAIDSATAKKALYDYVENAKAANMLRHDNYINAMQLTK